MIKPTLEEVAKYIKDEGFFDVNPEKFWNYYESIGWKVGKKPMLNWHCAIVTWTHTTKEKRLLFKSKTCDCGCGRKPTIIADGKCYAMDKCISKANKPLFSEKNITNNIKKDLTSQSEYCNIKRNWLEDLTKKVFKTDTTPKRSFQEMKMDLIRDEQALKD